MIDTCGAEACGPCKICEVDLSAPICASWCNENTCTEGACAECDVCINPPAYDDVADLMADTYDAIELPSPCPAWCNVRARPAALQRLPRAPSPNQMP